VDSVTGASAPAGLELRGVEKRFGTVIAVDGIELSVRAGEFMTLLGPSGAGKTTILKLVAGFEQPDAGTIHIQGRDIGRLSPAQRGVGVVFQHYALFPHMTVAENVAYGLKRHRIKREPRRRRVGEMLELVRLIDHAARYPRELSGGQQQRVALARALAFAPALLLMDEPLSALDRTLRTNLQDEIRRIHREVGATIVYVTHDREEALALSDRIAVIREGKVVQLGSGEELYDQPCDDFVARLFGECNVFAVETVSSAAGGMVDVTLDGRRIRALSATDTAPVSLVVRPDRLRVEGCEGDVELDVAIEDVCYLGETSRLRAHHDVVGAVVARLDPKEARGLARGDDVRLYFDPADAVVIARSA
jgi:putative spermidine/putrescine transport system ATP-binding protein